MVVVVVVVVGVGVGMAGRSRRASGGVGGVAVVVAVGVGGGDGGNSSAVPARARSPPRPGLLAACRHDGIAAAGHRVLFAGCVFVCRGKESVCWGLLVFACFGSSLFLALGAGASVGVSDGSLLREGAEAVCASFAGRSSSAHAATWARRGAVRRRDTLFSTRSPSRTGLLPTFAIVLLQMNTSPRP
jgi:hypothetical protein